MLRLIAVFALVVVFAVTAPAQAQGPSTGSAVTPPGSRIGLMPLTGLMEAADFMGFADTQTGASVMFNELPPEAWVQMRDGMTAQALRQRGIQEMARSTFKTAAGDALLIEGVQGSGATSIGKYMMVFPGPGFTAMVTVNLTPAAADRYSHADVRAMLASTIAVPTASISPRDALSFGFEETPRLKLLQTLGRQAAVLRETPMPGAPAQAAAAVISLARVEAVPADRVEFATRVLRQVEQITDVVVSQSVPRKVGPHGAIEQRATGKDRRTGAPVAIYHLLIAENDRVLRVVAFVEAAAMERWLAEFRSLADSVRLR